MKREELFKVVACERCGHTLPIHPRCTCVALQLSEEDPGQSPARVQGEGAAMTNKRSTRYDHLMTEEERVEADRKHAEKRARETVSDVVRHLRAPSHEEVKEAAEAAEGED